MKDAPPTVLAVAAVAVALAVVVVGVLLGSRGSPPPPPSLPDPPAPPCPPEMAAVPGGALVMGSAGGAKDEQPAHRVSIGAFCMDRTEVTVGAYAGCASCAHDEARDPACNGPGERDEHPMNCVTLEAARAFCQRVGKRLPTEPEWELAARGSAGREFPWGGERPEPRRVNAHLEADDGFPTTAPVGRFVQGQTSGTGLLDMAGNVAEWVDDPYCLYAQIDCSSAFGVVRGGSWATEAPASLRGAARGTANPTSPLPDVGFRCAK